MSTGFAFSPGCTAGDCCAPDCCWSALICCCCTYNECGINTDDSDTGRIWKMTANLGATDGSQCFNVVGLTLVMTTDGTLTIANELGYVQGFKINGTDVANPNDPQTVSSGDVISDLFITNPLLQCSPSIDPVNCPAVSIVCNNNDDQDCPCYEVAVVDGVESSNCSDNVGCTVVECSCPGPCGTTDGANNNVVASISGLACLCDFLTSGIYCSDVGDTEFNDDFELDGAGSLTVNYTAAASPLQPPYFTLLLTCTPSFVENYDLWILQYKIYSSFSPLSPPLVGQWNGLVDCRSEAAPFRLQKVFGNDCWTVPDEITIKCPMDMARLPAVALLKDTSSPCKYLGDKLGTVACVSCKGTTQLKTFACGLPEVSGADKCTIGKRVPEYACCLSGRCPGYLPALVSLEPPPVDPAS